MSSTRARDVPKGTGGGSNKTGGKTTNNKGDHKSDKADLNTKIQPTAEQMQIARIIESHRSEDPELQKKIKQVIEFTRATEDEASMALHSRENNVEDAIALLTEGGTESLESEWAQAGKKRKTKTPGQKNEALKDGGPKKDGGPVDNAGRDRSDKRNDRDSRPERSDREQRNNSDQQGEGSFDQRRGVDRGRGRGSSRGVRGGIGRGGVRIENNKENDESINASRGGYGGRFNNGPGRGARGDRDGGRGGFRGSRGGGFRGGDRDRDASRTFASRARGPREGDFSHHTIDVWENSQADPKAESKKALKVDQWDEFPSAEDWDNEEYTGSLAESKVFTASTLPQTAAGVNSAPTDTVTGGPTNQQTDTPSNGFVGSANHIGGANMSTSGSGVVAGQSIDLSLLLPKSASGGGGAPNPNPGANLLASIQSSYSSAAAQQIPVGNNQQPLPPRTGAANKVQTRRGPPSKIPSSGVEMPDESVAKLDVQFGGLDFGSTGSAFNTVVQHGTTKVGGSGDMMYSNLAQPKMDSYSAAAEKEIVQNKSVPPPTSAPPFQSQRNTQPVPGSMIIDSLNSKTVPISPNIDSTHSGSLSSVQSQNSKANNVPQSPQTQQQQQQPSYGSSANNNTGSAFVTYNTKPAPGFAAPGFPPVSQIQQTGNYGVPQGQGYGSSTNQMIMHQQQVTAGYHGMGLSTYGTQPLVSSSVQPSQLQSQQIPSQGITQMNNSTYGIPGMSSNPYHSANSIPNTSNYVNSSTYAGYGPPKSSLATSGVAGHQPGKETVNDVSNSAVSTSSSQLGTSAGLQSNSGSASSATGSKGPANATSVTNSSAGGSKLQSGASSTLPPGMMMPTQYIVNQAGVPLYGFQGPAMYGYDDSQQVQFLPRLPHPMATASYYDANAPPYTPGGGVQSTGRSDGSSLQGYGSDARFSRSDSSTASPVPSNLAGQSTQQMYNLPQAGYYYVGNNMMHPGAFPYGPPPPMYPTTAMPTPNNPSSGAQHSVANHQYQNKGYGSSYVPTYDTTGQPGNVTDYVNKNTYTPGSGMGGQNSTGKGSASTTGSSQSTDMSSSLYGKGHMNKINNPYEKPQYGANTGSPYGGSLGQQSNPLGGAGMGAAYNVYLPPPQPDGNAGQRQGGGQPKGGKPQYGGQQQQYWGGN